MITGSAAMVTDKLPGSEYASAWLRRAVEGNTLVFGDNLVHSQSVLTFPSGATMLGRFAHDPHQILRYRPNVSSTQFHPEFTVPVMRSYLARMMAQELERRDHYQRLEGQIAATLHWRALSAVVCAATLRFDIDGCIFLH